MQQANSQQSNQGQPGQLPASAAQPAQSAQMRPQSRMANPNEQGQPQQPHPQQPQQQQPPTQQQQSAQGQPQQPPTSQPGQQVAQLQGQQVGMTPQQQQIIMQRHLYQRQQAAMRQQALAVQQQAQNQMNQVQQQPRTGAGAFILRISQLSDHLSVFDQANGKDIAQWQDFVDRHFAPDGRLLHSFIDPGLKTRTFEVLRPTIARYFWTYFESGAQSLRLHTEHPSERVVSNNRTQVSYTNAMLTVSYPSGARLEMTGSLSALFAPSSDVIECLQIQQTGTEETVSRSEIERVLSSWSPPVETKSPKMTKKNLPKAQQKMQPRLDGLTIDHFPKTPKGTMGVTSKVQQFLELGETMNIMSELMYVSQERKLRPEQALEAWTMQYESTLQGQQQGNPQINLPLNGMPMGNRTPSMTSMQMPANTGNFSSPALSNKNLPMQQTNGPMNGSPHLSNNPNLTAPNMNMQAPHLQGSMSHTPSPRQGNMAAPPMVPQHSQQGTSSSAASANTSPALTNKRRRSIKQEDAQLGGSEDGTAGQPGGSQARVKPSPRMGKKAKPG